MWGRKGKKFFSISVFTERSMGKEKEKIRERYGKIEKFSMGEGSTRETR